ncbi:unnamed protein product [Mycetohabitans rhizoxinica HKI 454]|uniref:Uncharacterized protein n=1 Tax=Mycetohabitans rhizoxinica (strain DSM 19002 / CIP 109453 / HKI 454) TaxID=882378 RepID=E5ASU4_MYCRK|nr:unnamed protein product [Mycetohabitans rhizoxinica HKI 454]
MTGSITAWGIARGAMLSYQGASGLPVAVRRQVFVR